MSKLKIYGSKGCEVCEKIKKSLENLKRKDVKYEEFENLKDEDLKVLKEALKGKKETKLPIVVDEKEKKLCELIVTEDVILAKCGDRVKVLWEKEYEETLEAFQSVFRLF